ncbi:hypothetical protein EDC96DRAFT_578815 [Choanephora cucurbitarum]|nr:hypothetical protein EDC96DRAFT_578815 [Choanephora cucurbitarum]
MSFYICLTLNPFCPTFYTYNSSDPLLCLETMRHPVASIQCIGFWHSVVGTRLLTHQHCLSSPPLTYSTCPEPN